MKIKETLLRKRQNLRQKRREARSRLLKAAIALQDLMLALIILAIIGAGLFTVFNIMKSNADQKNAMDLVTTVMNIVDNIRAQSQGVLPEVDSPTAFRDLDLFKYYVSKNPKLTNPKFTYQCVDNGDSDTLVLTIPLKDKDLCLSIKTSLEARYKKLNTDELSYSFSCDGNVLKITEQGTDIICEGD